MSYKYSQKTSATIQVLVKVFPRWHHISAAKHRIFKLSLSVRLPSPARARMPSIYLQLWKFQIQVLEQLVFNWVSPPVCYGLVWHCCFMIGLRSSQHQHPRPISYVANTKSHFFYAACHNLWQLVIITHLPCPQHGCDRKIPNRCFIWLCAFEASNTS